MKEIEEELFQRTRELETIYDLSLLINQSLDLDTVFHTALEKALNVTGFEMGAIYLLNENGDTLERKSQIGLPISIFEDGKVLKHGEGVSGTAVKLKQPVFLSIDQYSSLREVPGMIKEGIQTLVGFPLQAKGKVVGTITLLSHSPRELSRSEIHLLENIGNQIGIALENAKLFSNVAKGKSEWETTFDAVEEGIIIIDKNYQILRVNKDTLRQSGLEYRDLIGKKCFEALERSDRPCERCPFSETLMTKKPVFLEKANRSTGRSVQMRVFPILDEAGEVVGAVEMARDVTEEKRSGIRKEVVNKVNKILASSLDVKKMIHATRIQLNRVLDFEKISIALFDEESGGYRFFAVEKDYEAEAFAGNIFFPLRGTGFFRRVIDTGEPIIISDFSECDSLVLQKLLKDEGIRSGLIFPLEYRGKIIGALNLGSRKTNHFSKDQFNLLRQIVPGLAISIQNALLFEETKRRLDELTFLQEEIKQSEKKYRTVVEGALDGVSVIGTDYQFIYVNEKMAEIQGCSQEELIGKDLRDFLDGESRALLMDRHARWQSGVKLSPHFELRIIRKDGEVRNVEISARAIKASKEDVNFIVISKDITDRKRAEEALRESESRFRLLVEHSTDTFVLHDLEGRIIDVNQHACESLGYTREELLSLSIQDIDQGVIPDNHAETWKRMDPGEAHTLEGVHTRKDGTTFPVEIRLGVFEAGGSKRVLGLVRDITERKKMEDRLVQAEKLRAVGEMASGVAHDFNNALAVILGNTQLLLHTAHDEEFKETLKIIEKVAKDSAQTVRRLQDFTKKRLHQELFSLDLNLAVRDCIEITKPKWKDEAQNSGIPIEMVTHLEEIPPVKGNASELREVITNMIFNSIEAMPEGGEIEIRTFQKDGEDWIQISDTGIGIHEEVKNKIFEPFFTTKPFSNTGLGLSMSYGIMRRMGGEIDVESQVGKGTTFTLSLPIDFDAKEESSILPAQAAKKKIGARILVIDDEASVQRVLSRILAQVNHQVNVAGNGEEGLRLFHENEFDVVLTDLGMPGMSGWDVCKAIKKVNPQTPVGMITGWGMEVSKEQMREFGLDFLISKPFDFNQIINKVAETMESKRM